MVRCDTHQFDEAAASCRSCGGDFCVDCLVWPRGHSHAALCIPCALRVSGVRRGQRARAAVR